MIWAKIEGDRVVGVCNNAPPTSENGTIEPGWEQRSEDDAAVRAYYAAEDAPQPEQPDWAAFRSQVGLSPAYLRAASLNNITLAINAALVVQLDRLTNDPSALPDMMRSWNAIAGYAKPTAVEIAALNAIAAQCKMPFTLDTAGRMVQA